MPETPIARSRKPSPRGTALTLTRANIQRFADLEVFVEILENVRGEDVFMLQSTSFPANDNLMELLVTIDALKRSSAKRITAVLPYYGYARQDRRTGPRTPISAKLVANLITVSGADRVLTMDLHAGQIQGFFDIPTDNLFAAPVFVTDIRANEAKYATPCIIVSPDVGGVVRARALAQRLDADLAIIDKRRERAGVSEVMNIIGDVDGRACILVDDIVDSAGTLCNAAVALIDAGASSVRAYTTHGVLSGGAVARIEAAPLDGTGDDRQHPGDRGGGRVVQNPAAFGGSADRRSHPPDHRRTVGIQPVRLIGIRFRDGRTRPPDRCTNCPSRYPCRAIARSGGSGDRRCAGTHRNRAMCACRPHNFRLGRSAYRCR